MAKSVGWEKSHSFAESLRYAGQGLLVLYRRERNVRRQLVLFLVALLLAFLLRLPGRDFAVIVVVAGMVLGAEMTNSTFEALADAIHPRYHTGVRMAKDMAAGVVLLVSLTAIVVGLFLFVPPLVSLLGAQIP